MCDDSPEAVVRSHNTPSPLGRLDSSHFNRKETRGRNDLSLSTTARQKKIPSNEQDESETNKQTVVLLINVHRPGAVRGQCPTRHGSEFSGSEKGELSTRQRIRYRSTRKKTAFSSRAQTQSLSRSLVRIQLFIEREIIIIIRY